MRPPGRVSATRALDEQLVAVGVTVGLRLVDPDVAREPDERPSVAARVPATSGRAAVGAHHVPRWIADDRVKAGSGQASAVRVEEDFGKFQFPVEEPPAAAIAARLSR